MSWVHVFSGNHSDPVSLCNEEEYRISLVTQLWDALRANNYETHQQQIIKDYASVEFWNAVPNK